MPHTALLDAKVRSTSMLISFTEVPIMTRREMKKAALLVMIITVISKIVGFVREIVLSYVFGASAITDP